MNICCVVVTYNRKELLKECIESLINQTYKIKTIIIIDNNSTDGTEEYLQSSNLLSIDNIKYIKLPINIGGAGGFYEGMKESMNYEHDWIWIMDDDCIPDTYALEELIKAKKILDEEKVSFLCSKVIGIDGKTMNIPCISNKRKLNGRAIWIDYLEEGISAVDIATFVSVLVNTDAIRQVGLPWKDFFIWGDDTEYTLRLTKFYGQGYVVGKSKVLHKRVTSSTLSIEEETNINRINMYKYMYRNNILIANYYNIFNRVKSILSQIKKSIFILFTNSEYKFKKSWIVFSSTIDGIFNIKLRRKFKNRMKM